MSTKQRFFDLVVQAIKEFDEECVREGTTYWFTVGEIADRAGVSKPTARKHVEDLVDSGHVYRSGRPRMPIYAVVKEA